jgi:predicted alpha/beta-hydrolase family hydrolase
LKKPSELKVRLETGADTTALVYPAAEAKETLILAHGAGAGQRSTFMIAAANALSSLGIDVLTFNFQYTEQQRRIPDRAPVLEACYLAVIDVTRREIESARRSLFIGGKSMGGRIATQVAAANPQLPIAGLVLLGYPLHPPGRPEQRRDKHLPSIERPMLFVQGSRDAFGTPAELSPIVRSLTSVQSGTKIHVVEGGDHSLKVSRGDAKRQAAAEDDIYRTVAAWVSSITSPSRVKP